MVRGVVAVVFLCLFLVNCGNPNTKADRYVLGDSESLLTGGATRFVSERPRYIPGDRVMPTLCTEPDPDVAVAFAKSASISANINNPSGVSGSGSGSYSSSETVTPLSGRTAGVIALRDGLYAACQTYVNGIIGHDAYALILSQYGNLLVALNGTGTVNQNTFTAQDAASTALLVSCLSEYDPTRLGARNVDGRPSMNPLLTPGFCSKLMEKIARGAPIAGTAAGKQKTSAKDGAKQEVAAANGKTTTTVTTINQKSSTIEENK